nr:Gag-Pol polyprotein [Tanacetum cinerariifolium]
QGFWEVMEEVMGSCVNGRKWENRRPGVLGSDGRDISDMCMYALTVSTMEPKNVKEAMTDPAWIDSMQEELFQIKRLDVWVLVPAPDNIFIERRCVCVSTGRFHRC